MIFHYNQELLFLICFKMRFGLVLYLQANCALSCPTVSEVGQINPTSNFLRSFNFTNDFLLVQSETFV